MSNKRFSQFQLTLEQQVVTLYAQLQVGASGAVASAKGGGIKSIVKETTDGQYTITLEDKYNRLLFVDAKVVHDVPSAVCSVQVLQDATTLQADFVASPSFKIQCLDEAGAAVNLEQDAGLMIKLEVRNSSVGRWD